MGFGKLLVIWQPMRIYLEALGTVKSANIEGIKLTIDANYGDFYLFWLKHACLNFVTIGMYGKCCAVSPEKFLDRRVTWKGTYVSATVTPLFLSVHCLLQRAVNNSNQEDKDDKDWRLFDAKPSLCDHISYVCCKVRHLVVPTLDHLMKQCTACGSKYNPDTMPGHMQHSRSASRWDASARLLDFGTLGF